MYHIPSFPRRRETLLEWREHIVKQAPPNMHDKKAIIFSKICPDDVSLLQIIEKQAYPNPWSEKIMHDCIQAGYQCIKMTPENEPEIILAYAFMMMGHEESHLMNITTAPEFLRQGLAQKMLHRLMLISRINHAKQMILEVRSGNPAAIALYHKHGFKTIGTRKNYYQYQGPNGERVKEDAIVMSCEVIKSRAAEK